MSETEPWSAVEQELDTATEQARRLVDATPGRLFTVRPSPSAWSAAECLSHLSISSEAFLPVLRKAIDDGRTKGLRAGKPPKMDLLGRILRWFLEPPIRSKVKTAAPFVPRAVRAKAAAISEFTSLQNTLKQLLAEARELDARKMRIVSPFDKRVKYNVYSAFRIVAAHQRRHLWQAEQAVNALKS